MQAYHWKLRLQVQGRLVEELEIKLVAHSEQDSKHLIEMYLAPQFPIMKWTLLNIEPEDK
jgi:hypothetical protein